MIWLIGLLFLLVFNVYFRLFPAYFPQLKVEAKKQVNMALYNNRLAEVQKQYPAYSPIAQDILAKQWVKIEWHKQKENLNKQINDKYLEFKKPFQNNGKTFIAELDCWHWAKYVKNVADTGHPGDSVKNGKEWDDYMTAPRGQELPYSRFNFYLSGYLYRVFKFIPFDEFISYLPIFFMAIFLSVLFFFMRQYFGVFPALITCFLVGMAPIFFGRSYYGWFKTDSFNLLFPLLIVWTYLLARNSSNPLGWILGCSFLIGLYAWTWSGWWFIIPVILAFEGCQALLQSIPRGGLWSGFQQSPFQWYILPSLLVLSTIFIWLFCGSAAFKDIGERFIQVLNFHKNVSLYPNVYLTVSEMMTADLNKISMNLGGAVIFACSIICIVLSLLSCKNYEPFKQQLLLMLLIWFAGMLFMSFRSLRFVELVLLPLAIITGWAIGQSVSLRYLAFTIPAFLAGATLIGISIYNGYQNGRAIYPIMTKPWYDALIKMDKELPKDAIINSWWDYGDWFTSVAKRRVIFDGQSQVSERSYWMAKALISNNEEEAVKILKTWNEGQRAYVLVDNSMIQKINPISFIGNWDFEKVKRYRKHADAEVKLIPNNLIDEWCSNRFIYSTENGKVVCSQELVNAMVSRLYFKNGEGLKHFKLVMDISSGDTIIKLFEVIW